MKKLLVAITTVFIFIATQGIAQELSYSYYSKPVPPPPANDVIPVLNFGISGNYTRGVTDNTLRTANLIRDVAPGYPVNWISKYLSVEISATSNGKIVKAKGVNETLTATQKNILTNADLGTVIRINILYNYTNLPEGTTSERPIAIELTVVPEFEAEFPGGREQLRSYLRKNIVDKITNEFEIAEVIFTINEAGEVTNAKITKTTGSRKADRIVLDGIKNMAKWIPAKNSSGKNVKQEFVFNVGQGGC